jgi:hypothetical protein
MPFGRTLAKGPEHRPSIAVAASWRFALKLTFSSRRFRCFPVALLSYSFGIRQAKAHGG